MARMLLVIAVLAAGLNGCYSAATGGSGGSSRQITQDELSAASAQSTLDAIRQLRPNWLKVRGQGSFHGSEGIVVYLDGSRAGGLEALHRIPVGDVGSIERLSAITASQRFGTDHPNGAIVIRTR